MGRCRSCVRGDVLHQMAMLLKLDDRSGRFSRGGDLGSEERQVKRGTRLSVAYSYTMLSMNDVVVGVVLGRSILCVRLCYAGLDGGTPICSIYDMMRTQEAIRFSRFKYQTGRSVPSDCGDASRGEAMSYKAHSFEFQKYALTGAAHRVAHVIDLKTEACRSTPRGGAQCTVAYTVILVCTVRGCQHRWCGPNQRGAHALGRCTCGVRWCKQGKVVYPSVRAAWHKNMFV